jgi:sorting nexin-9/18/33
VLNSTLAEMNEYHDAKAVDFRNLTSAYFDAEIAFHEAVLVKLKAARAAFEPSAEADQAPGGSRRPSSLEAQLASPSQSMKTELLQPSPHVSRTFESPPSLHRAHPQRAALGSASMNSRLTRSSGP